MLFAFSTRGLDQNWLNPTIIGVIREGMAVIDAGGTPAAWPVCVPEPQRARLSSRSGFAARLIALWQAYRGLTRAEKSVIQDAIKQQTNLPEVLANDWPCAALDDLPKVICGALSGLFNYMFNLNQT